MRARSSTSHESLLIPVTRRTHPQLEMPPRGQLSDEQIDDLVVWITKLTYAHSSRDFCLADLYGNVVHDILA